MFYDVKVPIPEQKGISTKRKDKRVYVYQLKERYYNKDKKYTVPIYTLIGKRCPSEPSLMFPNDDYMKLFPNNPYLSVDEIPGFERSSSLIVGPYIIINKIVDDYKLDTILKSIIGNDYGLLLDLASYMIVEESNVAQHYPDYAYKHVLMTEGMRVYSDSKISRFINDITKDQIIEFINVWNNGRKIEERIYISYDSSNKESEAGDIDLVEMGHSKNGGEKDIINYSIAYDVNNREPLFYELYPGSIVDVSELRYMLEKAAGYGYKNVGFILDRGYFAKENIQFMDKKGYNFVIMMKGMKQLAKESIEEAGIEFKDDIECNIRDFNTAGITLEKKLYPTDSKNRYFHVFYCDETKSIEKARLLGKTYRKADILKKREGKEYICPSELLDYFVPYYECKGEKIIFKKADINKDYVNDEIAKCGYYVIITSEKMSASDALHLYKSRDSSEKLFCSDKTFLGSKSMNIHSTEALTGKLFVEFIALIIRNKMFACLSDRMKQHGKKDNFMTVPASLEELGKIEMLKLPKGNYTLDHAITATQKEILTAFGLTTASLTSQVEKIGKVLQSINATLNK